MSRKISVVICTFNRAPSLRITLNALRYLDHPQFEVVVVNGPSTDDTEDVLAAYDRSIKVVRTDQRNLSASRNLGIAAASGELVAFIDDDAYPDPSWLTHLEAAFDDPGVGAAGGPTLDHTGASWQARYSLANRRGNSWVADGHNPTDLYGSPYSDTFVYTIGTNSCFRREALLEIGGFDEEYEYYLDETDVCVRLLDQGWLVRALDDGVVYHKFLPSDIRTEQRAIKNRYSVVKNRVYFALRHGQRDLSVSELLADASQFIKAQRAEMLSNVAHGLLTTADVDQFDQDARAAADLAVSRALGNQPRIQSREWLAGQDHGFLAYPTLRPEGRLHLVLVSQEYPPGPVNGIGRFVHALASGLADRGHVVRVVTRSDSHHRVDLEEGVWVHRVPAISRLQPPGVELPDRIWDHSASVADEIDRIDMLRAVDLVQFPNWDVEGLATALRQAYPTVLSLHTPLAKVVELDAAFPADHADVRQLVAAETALYSQVTAYLANSTSVIGEIERCYGVELPLERIALVPHGLPQNELVDGVQADDRSVNVLFVGRLEHRKGIDTLLEAIPAVLARCPSATFSIVGDDSLPLAGGGTYRESYERSALSSSAKGRVTFCGRVTDEELERRYARCDVLVAPSRYESFGLMLLEAMRLAKPVVACAIGGMVDIIESSGNGELVPPGDPEALAKALITLIEDPSLRARYGARSLELYEERFNLTQMVDGAELLYQRLVNGKSATGGPITPAPGRGLWIDVAELVKCPTCGGRVNTERTTATADGLTKRGRLVCDGCDLQVAAIDQFIYDFHAIEPRRRATTEPLVVPVLGERRVGADELSALTTGRWSPHRHFLYSEGHEDDTIVCAVRGTDATVRLLGHPYSGVVELLVDGEVVAEVDLYLAEGALVTAHSLFADQPDRRRVIEIRPAGAGHPDAKGRQVFVEEIVLFGPLRPELGFGPPAAINRGNPYSPNVMRYMDPLPDDAWILECGGGDRRGPRPRHVNFEYLGFELADAYGDIHRLPFADSVFDYVFTQAVFEHVRNPFEAAKELVRVAKPGCLIVTEVAFLQPLHAVPFHFFNMTQWGVEELFTGCEIVKSDWLGDLSMTLDWIVRSANLDADAPPELLADLRRGFAELDQYVDHDDLKSVASGYYLVARKPA